jgi:hypothetical protein
MINTASGHANKNPDALREATNASICAEKMRHNPTRNGEEEISKYESIFRLNAKAAYIFQGCGEATMARIERIGMGRAAYRIAFTNQALHRYDKALESYNLAVSILTAEGESRLSKKAAAAVEYCTRELIMRSRREM